MVAALALAAEVASFAEALVAPAAALSVITSDRQANCRYPPGSTRRIERDSPCVVSGDPSNAPPVPDLPHGPYGMDFTACMSSWDPGTKMTRSEWRRTCLWQLREETKLF
jgi:hypothetical protein